jgi:hypothetical protein
VFFTIDLVRDVRRRRRAARAAGQPVIERDPTGEINVV